jgi:hypothetical protein
MATSEEDVNGREAYHEKHERESRTQMQGVLVRTSIGSEKRIAEGRLCGVPGLAW